MPEAHLSPHQGGNFICFCAFWVEAFVLDGAFSYLQISNTRILGMEHR